jgi:hypothetical protein
MIKRYDNFEGMNEEKFGEWVKYEDIKHLLPKHTAVDMHILINSGIDCEFFDGYEWSIGYRGELLEVISYREYSDGDGGYRKCRPRMNHWHSFSNTTHWANIKDLVIDLVKAGFSIVFDDGLGEFKFEGLREGFIYPWEAE